MQTTKHVGCISSDEDKKKKTGKLIPVPCTICGEVVLKDEGEYEANKQKGINPLCKECGLDLFFGGK